MKKEMLINVLQPEECRIAILEDGVLEELYVERTSHESYVGNIYKGRIVNIEPSIQAAFVDFGVGRNGFLHVSDVEPTYWKHLESRLERSDRGAGRSSDRAGARLPAYLQDFDMEELEEPIAPPPQQQADPTPAVQEPAPQSAVVAPPQSPATVSSPGDFAAGVDLDSDSAPTQPPSSNDIKPATPATEPNEPLRAHPETLIEEESEKPRRRSRTPSRRRNRAAAADAQRANKESTTDKSETSAEAEPSTQQASSEEPPTSRLQDSAERRTDAGDVEQADESKGGSGLDPELFFPNTPPALPAPAPQPFHLPPPLTTPGEASEPVAETTGTPTPAPPRRSRSAGRYASIEDALEADLAQAEVDEEVPAVMPTDVPNEPDEGNGESRPRSERTVDDEADEDFEDASLRREDRGGRRSRRRRGNERGDRGDRRVGLGGGGGRPGAGRPRPLIQDIFKRGQEVIVQVIKEGIGTKGPTLSTYISIPGRYLVLMPCLNRTGVSRKIEDEEARRRLRQMFNELKPPRGLGFIMRTAAIDKNKREIQRDLVYLSRLWQVIARRIRKLKSPAEIYQESEMVTRTIRDNFSSDIDTIWVDERNAFEAAQEFMQVVMPRYADRIKFFEDREPLFHKFGLEEEIARIQQKKVPLPNGGSIVIEQTEALVAIDVNSGNFRAADQNAEETMYQMNLLAAREIARQLRLRDLGGVIVNDFIDMREEKHRRGVERALREAMKRDRARTKILKISQFGIIEMTRQRVRPSLKRSGYMDCPYCKGMAQVKTPETMAIEVMRLLQLASCRENVVRVEVSVPPEVADYLLNKKRREIGQFEDLGQMSVTIKSVFGTNPEHLQFICLDRNDNEVRLSNPEPTPLRRR